MNARIYSSLYVVTKELQTGLLSLAVLGRGKAVLVLYSLQGRPRGFLAGVQGAASWLPSPCLRGGHRPLPVTLRGGNSKVQQGSPGRSPGSLCGVGGPWPGSLMPAEI